MLLFFTCGIDQNFIEKFQADMFFYKAEASSPINYLASFNGDILVVQGKKTNDFEQVTDGSNAVFVSKTLVENIDFTELKYKNIANISKNNLLLINKQRKVDSGSTSKLTRIATSKYYRFNSKMLLSKEPLDSLWVMLKSAYFDGQKSILLTSAYRSSDSQALIFSNSAHILRQKSSLDISNKEIEKIVNETVAKPGYSEHQTGMAIDMVSNGATRLTFKNTKFYKWLLENSYLYGFIERYPKGKSDITGYNWETWHYRYVGLPYSKYLTKNDLTLEEFYKKSKSGEIININYKEKTYSIVYIKGAKYIYVEKGITVQMLKITENEYYLVLIQKKS